jgi:uncharacterized protein YjbJ (UPF0337 family)
MAQDVVKRRWKQLEERARERWRRFSIDDVAQIDGDRERLVSKIQERYGRSREQAEGDVAQWLAAEGDARAAQPGKFGHSN